jgi:hypothetical protein
MGRKGRHGSTKVPRDPQKPVLPSSNKSKRSTLKAKHESRRKKQLEAQGRIVAGHEIPKGALPANPDKLARHNSYSPRLYYVDYPFTCRDCGSDEVWTATQQKWYYEVAKGSIYGRAVRCRTCRRRHRQQVHLAKQRSQRGSL